MLKLVIFFYCFHSSSSLTPSKDGDIFMASLTKIVSQIFMDMPSCLVIVLSKQLTLSLPDDKIYLRVHPDENLYSTLRISYTMKCTGYLIDEDSSEFFLTTLNKARSDASERHTPKVVILPNREGNYSKKIFSHPESAFIPDMIALQIINNNNEKDKEAKEFYVITNNFQENSKVKYGKIVGIWPSVADFFPDKTNNLMGKGVVVASLHYPPYVLLRPVFDGMEARICYTFCELYNCNLSFLSDEYLWGEIFENGTGVGVSGNVYTDLADFGIGALYLWLYEYSFIDYSYPYLNTRVTVLVPKPAKVAEWRIPFLPFSLTMWALQVISIITAAAIMHSVNILSSYILEGLLLRGEFSTAGGILLRALAMALLQPPPTRLPSGSPLRRFFTIFEVLFLFFTTIYSGALSSVLTVPLYYPPIDTPLQLYDAGIPWAADHNAWVASIQGATDQPMKGIAERFEVHTSEAMIELSRKGGYGFSIEIMPAGHVTQTKHLSGEMLLSYHVMKHELYTTSLVTTFRKGSPYTEKMNQLIGKLLDSGLLLLWETEVTLTHLSTRLQTALKLSEGSKIDVHEPTKLKLIHIQGAFILLAIGLSISIIIFILEKMESFPHPKWLFKRQSK